VEAAEIQSNNNEESNFLRYIPNTPVNLSTEELVEYIGSRKMLRIERWRDEYGSWRAGIEWYGEGQLEFLTEKMTLRDCLLSIYDFMNGNHPEFNADGSLRNREENRQEY
jgi:hypothetical protein